LQANRDKCRHNDIMYKASKKELEVFKTEAKKWIRVFGLVDWEIVYGYDEANDCRASCTADKESMIALIYLSRDWNTYKPKLSEIRKMAFHEVCELLLAKFRLGAEDRYTTEDELETERHAIIRVLENTIYRKVL